MTLEGFDMAKFLAGVIVGSVLGTSVYAAAQSFMTGWEVTQNGVTVCYDPVIWRATREIECD